MIIIASVVLFLMSVFLMAIDFRRLGGIVLAIVLVYWLGVGGVWMFDTGIPLLFCSMCWLATWAFKIVACTFLMTLFMVFCGPVALVGKMIGKK